MHPQDQVHRDLVHLGRIFREARESKKLSLKEIESEISIRVSCLEAIETGQLGRLISPVYARGFICKYADCLDLDGDQLLRDHPYVLQLFHEFSNKDLDSLFEVSSLMMRDSHSKDLRSSIWKGIFVVISILIVWWLATVFHIL